MILSLTNELLIQVEIIVGKLITHGEEIIEIDVTQNDD